MIPLPLVTAAKAVWYFLTGIPWQAWVVVAVLLVGWRYGEHRYEAGITDERTRWVAAQEKADAEAEAAAQKRDKAAGTINDKAAGRAEQVSADTRDETAKAVERVIYETRTIEVPAHCPTGLPDRVRDEGRAAVDRARAAGG